MLVCCIKLNFTFHTVAKLTDNNQSCPDNVAYDTVSSTIKISTQDNMTCSGNIAYASTYQVNKADLRASSTHDTPV